jgi:hypothetical protein
VDTFGVGAAGIAARADPGADFERSVWPGAIDDTNAAMPAVNPAAPAIDHRRTRETLCSAASRSSAASD